MPGKISFISQNKMWSMLRRVLMKVRRKIRDSSIRCRTRRIPKRDC